MGPGSGPTLLIIVGTGQLHSYPVPTGDFCPRYKTKQLPTLNSHLEIANINKKIETYLYRKRCNRY